MSFTILNPERPPRTRMQKNDQSRQRLASEEWNLDYQGEIPDWQLMAMSHYEYARCSNLMLQAVSAIRNPGRLRAGHSHTKGVILPFANYLGRQFPEFPTKPWEKIDSKIRSKRLADLGIHESNGLYSFAPAWECQEIFSPQAQIAIEELTDFAGESYGIFKIDFGQENSVIEQQFSSWLENRRLCLLKKYDSTGKLAAGIIQNENDSFRGKPPRKRKKGGGAPSNKYRLALTALGNLRAFVHARRDVRQANKMTEQKDLSSWNKYETYAAKMLQCMQSACSCRVGIVDVFHAATWRGHVGFGNFIAPPRSLDERRTGKTNQVRELLARDFTIAELRYL